MKRAFLTLRRKLPAPPPFVPIEEVPGHARDVKNFVREYGRLQELCASAFNGNNETAALGFIDQMKRLERRIRFLPEKESRVDDRG